MGFAIGNRVRWRDNGRLVSLGRERMRNYRGINHGDLDTQRVDLMHVSPPAHDWMINRFLCRSIEQKLTWTIQLISSHKNLLLL
jgi:hypothetical protein